MRREIFLFLSFGLFLMLGALPTLAIHNLDLDAEPTHGGTVLDNFIFLNEYVTAYAVGGGRINLSSETEGRCKGNTSSQPDFEFDWIYNNKSQRVQQLNIFFVGGSDSTIFIVTPEDRWHCSDNSFNTIHPTISFNQPAQGTYKIWVGSKDRSQTVEGNIYISAQRHTPRSYPLQLRQYEYYSFAGTGGGSDGIASGATVNASITGVNHNIENDGLYVWVDLLVNGRRGRNTTLAIWPRYTHNDQLILNRGGNTNFTDRNGYVISFTRLTPGYDSTRYEDVRLVIPYNQLPSGSYEFYIQILLQDENTGDVLAEFVSASLVRMN